MKVRSSEYPDECYEFGTAQVKRTIRKLYDYARVDFEIPANEIDNVVRLALTVLPNEYFDNDEVIWSALDLIIIP